MKTAAMVLLVVGVALGTIGGTIRVLTVVFGDSILRTVQANRSQLPGNAARVEAGVAQAADRSPGHLLAIAGDLALVLIGGAAGIAACTSRRTGPWRTILSGIAVAAGVALLLLQSWVSAGAYVIGGFLTLVMADWTEKTEGTS